MELGAARVLNTLLHDRAVAVAPDEHPWDGGHHGVSRRTPLAGNEHSVGPRSVLDPPRLQCQWADEGRPFAAGTTPP